jgi:hypothetical protein
MRQSYSDSSTMNLNLAQTCDILSPKNVAMRNERTEDFTDMVLLWIFLILKKGPILRQPFLVPLVGFGNNTGC